jgi:protein SCO1
MVDSRRRLSAGWALFLAATLLMSGCDRLSQPTPFKAVDITGAPYAKDFELPDVQGRVRSIKDFKGQVVVVFFGFTQCPDVCPSTLLELAQTKKLLGADGARLQGVFITLDPERDTAALLQAYTANFDPDLVALRGTPEALKATAQAFKVFYARAPGKTPESYSIDHTAGSYVFDTKGQVRLFTRHGTGAQALADDLKLLLAQR